MIFRIHGMPEKKIWMCSKEPLEKQAALMQKLSEKINFMIGLCIGELAALRWTDWMDRNDLHIIREEIRKYTIGSIKLYKKHCLKLTKLFNRP